MKKMNEMTFNEQYDFLADVIGVHYKALDLAYGLNGTSLETTNDILWYYTGYNDIDQWIECNDMED